MAAIASQIQSDDVWRAQCILYLKVSQSLKLQLSDWEPAGSQSSLSPNLLLLLNVNLLLWHVTPSDAALCVSTQRAYWLAQGMGGSGILPPVLHNQHVLSHKQSLYFLVLSSASATDKDKEKDKDKHTCCCLPQTIHMPSQLAHDKYPSILVLSSDKVN